MLSALLVLLASAFSPDGELVVTASEDGTERVWECGVACEPLPALLELAPQLAGTLSSAERARYLRSELIGS